MISARLESSTQHHVAFNLRPSGRREVSWLQYVEYRRFAGTYFKRLERGEQGGSMGQQSATFGRSTLAAEPFTICGGIVPSEVSRLAGGRVQ
jgi:hypothetical protein